MFRIGVHQLPAGQAGLVRALIQLLAHENSSKFAWTFASEGPYDALIVNAESPDIRDPAFRRQAKALSALGSTPASLPADLEVLDWPLRADRLESWLTRVQRSLGVAPAPDATQAPIVRYRLKRWPPDELLHGDAQRIRLATLLSRKALDAQELAHLSGQDPERCATFIHLLQGFRIVDAHVEHAPAPVTPAPSTSPQARLIRSIRQRFGI